MKNPLNRSNKILANFLKITACHAIHLLQQKRKQNRRRKKTTSIQRI
jgi:hypothetical protein